MENKISKISQIEKRYHQKEDEKLGTTEED